MSTLPQIESAVAGLTTREQWSLLTWLQSRLLGSEPEGLPQSDDRSDWVDEVRALREQCSTGKPGTPVAQLITEIRS